MNEINNKLEIENDKIRAMENEIKIHEADAEESLAAKRSEFEQIKALVHILCFFITKPTRI